MFINRSEAGKLLSGKLQDYKGTDTVILAIPRGGVPVGYEVAKALHLPLNIVLSKKIGHPGNKEFAIGSVSLDTVIADNYPGVSDAYIQQEIIHLRKLLAEKQELYMGSVAPPEVEGKNVIIVDDGIATGNTVLVSIAMLRKKNPRKIIVAVPVVPLSAVSLFKAKADEFVYLLAPEYFGAVGAFYEEFGQVEDEEAIWMLRDSNKTH